MLKIEEHAAKNILRETEEKRRTFKRLSHIRCELLEFDVRLRNCQFGITLIWSSVFVSFWNSVCTCFRLKKMNSASPLS